MQPKRARGGLAVFAGILTIWFGIQTVFRAISFVDDCYDYIQAYGDGNLISFNMMAVAVALLVLVIAAFVRRKTFLGVAAALVAVASVWCVTAHAPIYAPGAIYAVYPALAGMGLNVDYAALQGLSGLLRPLWQPLYLVSWLLLAVTAFLGKQKPTKLWGWAAGTAVAAAVIQLILQLRYLLWLLGELHLLTLLLNLLTIAAPALMVTFLACFLGARQPAAAVPGPDGAVVPVGEGYVDMAKCVLLLLLTFGIYYLIWIYRTTRYLNRVENMERRNPTTKLLLCMFVPFYSIYWMYQSARRVDVLANSRGIPSDLSTLCLILAIFVGIVPPMLMQDKINAVERLEAGAARPYAPPQPEPARAEQDVAAALRQYKELLDQGVLTQEEFDQKKKQLLKL